MNYIVSVGLLLLLTACSMAPNQNLNNIRIIKEEPKKYVSHEKYNTKVEQVKYTDSVATPEAYWNGEKRNTPKVSESKNKYAEDMEKKVSSRVSSRTNKIKNRTESKVDHLIEGSIDSLFR